MGFLCICFILSVVRIYSEREENEETMLERFEATARGACVLIAKEQSITQGRRLQGCRFKDEQWVSVPFGRFGREPVVWG